MLFIQIEVDDYYWHNSCDQLCTKQETRECNVQTCPINCVLGDYGPWSDCDPCIEKQVKVRSILRPGQFGGQPCTEPLVTFQPCVPSKLCKIEEADCKNKFLCDSGRCIPHKLECNGENDCGDNSDERHCGRTKAVCPQKYYPIPNVQLMGTGFHFLAGEPRGDVLDNSFTGGICKTVKSSRASNPYRVPANLETVNFEESSFVRIHKAIKVFNFTMKTTDLQLSDVFLKALHHLPLEYNSALYSRIFDDFGTHYFTSGSLGGKYDLLYQFSNQELQNSGLTEEETRHCVQYETKTRFLFFTIHRNTEERCTTNKLSEKYEGSFLQGSEKAISLVQGGRSHQAAALAWEKGTSGPEEKVFSEWVESVKENPAVIDFELAPITDLVRNIPCAVTKRNNLRKAFQEYAAKFDPCQCAPCPNNGRPRLSGTECLCVCQSGTYGENCERRSPDYKSGTECLKPVVQDVLTISPFQRVYKIGESIELTCPKGSVVAGPSRYTCKGDSWTPPISDSLTCEKDNTLTKSKGLCQPGQKQSGSKCICMSPEEDCRYEAL
ncbi:Complement component C6 [Cricetulus griseus]|uniref:Complement component C6 n=1 Tax=Cricetulus griseus TaxID=10029 RepID=G3HHG0_CRIGR|nr:Complement component C6 [Cricetulus griseus]